MTIYKELSLPYQKQGWDKHFQANTVRNRNVLSTVRLGMEVLRHCQQIDPREPT